MAGSPQAESIIRQTTEVNRLVTESTGRIQRLEAQLDRTAAAQQRFEAAQRTINSAVERGRLSQERANQLLDMARQKYETGAAAANRFGAANDNAERALGSLAARAGPLGQMLSALGPAGVAAAAAIGALTLGLSAAITEAEKFERLSLRTEAVVRATGFTAGLTAQQIRALSQDIARSTLASTEGVEQAAQKLLTFRSISGETFGRTLRAAQDLAAVGFGNLQSAATQLGKALENPRQGISALTEVGVTFTATQRDMITAMVDAGRTADAQRLILAAVESQVGGAGAAESGGLAGAYDTLSQNVQEFLTRIGNLGPIQLATGAVNLLASAVGALDRALAGLIQAASPEAVAQRAVAGAQSALERARANVPGERNTSQGIRGRLAAAAAAQTGADPREVYNEQVAAAERALEQAQIRLLAIQREGDDERAQAAIRGAGERARIERDTAQGALDQLRRTTDRSVQIQETYNSQVATIQRAERAGILSTAEAQRELAAADRRRTEALEQLNKVRGGSGGRGDSDREAREAERHRQERNRLIASLDEEAAANIRLEETLRRLEEARRRNLVSEEEAQRYSAMARQRRDEEVRRLYDKSDLDRERIKEQEAAARELGGAFADAFESAIVKGAKLSDILKQLEQDLMRIITRTLVTKPLEQWLGGLASSFLGGGGMGGMFGGDFAGEIGAGVASGMLKSIPVMHEGGIVGVDGGRRDVPLAAFYGAPRYHSGGFAGRMPFANDEVPAVLRRGELVLTQAQQQAVASNAGRPIVINQTVKAEDPGAFHRTKNQMGVELRRGLARASRNV